MFPAARVGDTTASGDAITGPGVATVLIANMPASVMGDMVSGAACIGTITVVIRLFAALPEGKIRKRRQAGMRCFNRISAVSSSARRLPGYTQVTTSSNARSAPEITSSALVA